MEIDPPFDEDYQSINLYLKSGKSPYTNTQTHAGTKHNLNIQ